MALYASGTARTALAALSGSDGKLSVPDLATARRVAAEASAAAGEVGGPAATAGEIYALSQLEEAFRRLMASHVGKPESAALARALGDRDAEALVRSFGTEYSLPGGPEDLARELLPWMVLEENPAAARATRWLLAGPFRSDPRLAALRETLERELSGERPGGGDPRPLLELLRAPARAEPESLAGQLRYAAERWGESLALDRDALLRGVDLLAEEAKGASFGPGPGPVETPSFAGLEEEAAQFSSDWDWMPSVVLLAKNVPVWLYQLSVAFDRAIDRLDDVPDEVLDEIAGSGFTGLWLIGVWERSDASRRLKRMAGNPEAAGSAYSVRRYGIAEDLGGEAAVDDLRRRCARRGVRLAADMVPNHMGIDSDWVLDEPQRFLSLPSSPFPAYSFTGPDLSPRGDVGIYVEDHYADHSDAAVVFKRVDRSSGEERFVYHGNDGTHMPWNDTAQLDYLDRDTREAVIRTILGVARRFPIIRFDAAMTLARRHFQRLWFPAPGTGGDIPSRAERGLSREEFAERMPEEFWREVVDRFAAEAPDTLLLAEAFWLMEGYFVRTLGMHRVYNSAFMHMVRDLRNSRYRRLIRDTLAFDPRILGRYVNFLTNPDESSAVEQFGRDDRYFGACVLLVTLPGLPMFGHGQVEGYAEKYGMEYRRSYSDEPRDEDLVARHEREIFPLLRRRRRFAGVERFELYDFVAQGGDVVEDVFVYSNGAGDERSLVVFNNSPTAVGGTVGKSAPRADRDGTTAGEALGLAGGEGSFWVFDDLITEETSLRAAPAAARAGLHLEIPAFGYRVFENFRVVVDDDEGRYRRLAARLAGRGTPDLERSLADLDLEPAAAALRDLFASSPFAVAAGVERGPDDAAAACAELAAGVEEVLDRLPAWVPAQAAGGTQLVRSLKATAALLAGARSGAAASAADPGRPTSGPIDVRGALGSRVELGVGLVAAQILAGLAERSRLGAELPRRMAAGEALGQVLERLGVAGGEIERTRAVVELALAASWAGPGGAAEPEPAAAWIRDWTADPRARELVGFHHAAGERWIRREALEDLALRRVAFGLAAAVRAADRVAVAAAAERWARAAAEVARRAREAGYSVDRLRAGASAQPETPAGGAAAGAEPTSPAQPSAESE